MTYNIEAMRKPLVRKLLTWYRKNKRDLPWRETKDSYCIWIAEIMLQQTRVDTVVPYYLRFLKAFPDIGGLAVSKVDRMILEALPEKHVGPAMPRRCPDLSQSPWKEAPCPRVYRRSGPDRTRPVF